MSTAVKIENRAAVRTAGVRRTVPMEALTGFFSDAFTQTMRAMTAQGVMPAGPPFGKYYAAPTATIDVEAGFPVAQAIEPSGEVVPGSLPGGSIAEAEHIGSYDDMERTYAVMEQFIRDAGLTPGPIMWESYLTGPDVEPNPRAWRTVISWPVGA